jgi:predicted permease
LAGRYSTEKDKAETPPIVIVDDTFVRRHFSSAPLSQAIGKRLRFGGEGEPWRENVGVVSHVRQTGLEEEGRAAIYQPWLQMNPRWLANSSRAMDMIVKTSTDPETMVAPIRGVVRTVDPDQPIANVRTLSSIVDETLAPRKFTLSVLSIFALVAFLLGAIGLYGVMAYHVAQRTREMGIRMALGAQRGNVMRLILKQGMTLVAVAVVIGLACSWMLTRLMKSLLFEVSATDAVAFSLPPVLLIVVALLACVVPARRATKVDPLVALRDL